MRVCLPLHATICIVVCLWAGYPHILGAPRHMPGVCTLGAHVSVPATHEYLLTPGVCEAASRRLLGKCDCEACPKAEPPLVWCSVSGVANGMVSEEGKVLEGATVSVTCNQGFAMEGEDVQGASFSAICVKDQDGGSTVDSVEYKGILFPHMPVCVAVPPPPSSAPPPPPPSEPIVEAFKPPATTPCPTGPPPLEVPVKPGFNGAWYYIGEEMQKMPDVTKRIPDASTENININYQTTDDFSKDVGESFPGKFAAATWFGLILINTAGTYTFETNSMAGARVWIDGEIIIDIIIHDYHVHETQIKTHQALLTSGYHHLKADWYGNEGEFKMIVSYLGPDTENKLLPVEGYNIFPMNPDSAPVEIPAEEAAEKPSEESVPEPSQTPAPEVAEPPPETPAPVKSSPEPAEESSKEPADENVDVFDASETAAPEAAEQPAETPADSAVESPQPPAPGPPLVHAYDSSTGKAFSGPDTEGRYNKDKWEGSTEDPFGFRKRARIWKEKREEAQAKFDSFIKEHDADTEYINALKKAAEVSQRKTDEMIHTDWKGKLPPLIYRDNHWLQKP